LHGRLLLSHLLVIVVAMTVAGFSLLSLVQGYLLDSLQSALEAQAALIAPALLAEAGVELRPSAPEAAYNALQQQQIANLSVEVLNEPTADAQDSSTAEGSAPLTPSPASIALTAELPTHVQVVDRSGGLLFESGLPGPEGLVRSGATEAALAGETGRTLLRGDRVDWLVLALPLQREGEPVGALTLAHPLSDVAGVLSDLRARLLLAAGLAAVLAGLLGALLASRLVRPLAKLTTAASRLSEGDYEVPVPVDGRDEIGALSRTFDQMRTSLKSTERMRTQFISDVSHELRTPLTGIKGLVETLQDGAVEDPEVRDRFLASIDSETERLTRLTNDLLVLTRADARALELRITQLDLAALVRSTLDRLEPEAGRQEISLEFDPPPEHLIVAADSDRLEQVLLNLLDNALKHAPPGSAVEVKAERLSTYALADLQPAMRATAKSPADGRNRNASWALIRVRDWGSGIPAESLNHVTERFYRAESARTREHGGSGLGLSIATALVELHGGVLWVESPLPDRGRNDPAGTQASFTIPCA
jgi:signal transduction histidine kinase